LKIKVISDGTALRTRIVNAETGEPIDLPVTKITWECAARDQVATLVLTCQMPVAVELVGESEVG
jgi:hypothetical protein